MTLAIRRALCAVILPLLAACMPATDATDVDAVRLEGPDPGEWLTHGRTYEEQRFSPLTAIDTTNVGRLGLVWHVELPTTRGLEATPLVADGVIYTTGSWSVVYALDARTGETLWTHDPRVPRERARVICCDVVNRGVALYRDRVFVGTLDGRLVALDRSTGEPVWEVQTTDPDGSYSITGAPRVARGMVLIGNGGAEFGVRGYLSAYDAGSGELRWRTYTVPGDPADGFESEALERAAETWSGSWWRAGGGGTVWDAIVYDPELALVYFGTGNGSPWFRDLRSPGGGDNLFLSSILAVRAEDGTLVWHYQTTPGDNWDYTATQPLVLAELAIAGRSRKVIMQAPKNGFFYVLDRETGELLSADPFVEVSWAEGVDPESGRPIESAGAYRGTEPVLVSPGPQGGHNWQPMAFHPGTGLVYFGAREGDSYVYAPTPGWLSDPTNWNTGQDPSYTGPLRVEQAALPPPHGRLVAWDPVRRREVWRVEHPVLESGGVLATAGGLVFQGRSDGVLLAYRATDGAVLWEFDAGTGIMAPPVTWELDGVQRLTLMVGWGGGIGVFNPPILGPVRPGWGRILTFALDGRETLEPRPYGHSEPPTPGVTVSASPETLERGGRLYAQYCQRCHGVGAVAGPMPDLRYSSAAVHERFAAIVLDGERVPLGMPSFGDVLGPEEARAIQAWVLNRAAQAAAADSSPSRATTAAGGNSGG